MAKNVTRLGRGLGSLISNGGAPVSKPAAIPVKAETKKKKAVKGGKSVKVVKTEVVDVVAEGLPGYSEVSVDLIEVNPYQPRREINEAHVKELASSIGTDGLLQPIVVRKKAGNRYELIAGERRWRACKSLKMSEIPARVLEVSDSSSAVIALVENLQRENLNPVDEAMGYASLMKDFDLTQESVSERVGKPRASVANSLRLLQLDKEIQGYLSKGLISVGHAKVLLGVEDSRQRLLLVRRIIEGGMSVRQAEELVKSVRGARVSDRSTKISNSVQSAVIQDLEKQMRSHLNAGVKISHGAKKGKIMIEYKGNDDLNRILERIGFMSSKEAAVL